MRKLLESIDSMSAAEKKPTGPRWPGYLKGTDSAKKVKDRMVGDGTAESVEESESFLKELSQVINSNPVKRDMFQEWQQFKLNEQASGQDSDEQEVDVIMRRPVGSSDYDKVEFYHRFKDGREEPVPHGSYYHNKWYRAFTSKEDPMTQELIKGLQAPVKRSKEFVPQEPDTVQDIKVPGQDKGRYQPSLPNWSETDGPISEYGAPGSGIGNDTATNPAEVAAKGQERKVGREQAQGQIQGLVAQITGLRRQLADLNKQFPQGANPVEKAMSLQQMQGQRNGIKSQIVDLAKQIAASRQQAT